MNSRGRLQYVALFCLVIASTIFIFRGNSFTKSVQDQTELHQYDVLSILHSNATVITKYTTVYRKDLPPLQEALDTLDWEAFEEYLREQRQHTSGNIYLPTSFYETYLNILVPYLEQPPQHDIEIPIRPFPLTVNCANPKYANVLTGEPRSSPVKAYDFVPFNAELDVLEMRLYELNDTVDYFIILESTLTHRAMRKPLFYARNTERFAAFQNKIIHLIMDDGDVLKYRHSQQTSGDDWGIENLARYLIWKKFLTAFGDPEPDAILIHGDLDEIPSGEAIHHFRHCQLKSDAFTTGLYNYVFDFYHLTTVEPLNVPLIGTREGLELDRIGGFCRFGCRLPKSVPMVAWTGSHVTYHAKVPFLMWKHVSLAEGGQVPRGDLTWLRNVQKVEEELVAGRRICCAWDHWPHVADAPIPKPNFIPWFAQYNQKRFPYLFRKEGELLDTTPENAVGIENVFASHQH